MAGTRSYVRGSNGRFAGAGAGTKVTQGKSGGFANQAFRARVTQSKVARASTPTGKARAARASTVNNRIRKVAQNKKVQKAAVRAAVAGGIYAYNRKKHGPGPGIKPVVKELKTAIGVGGKKTKVDPFKSPFHVNVSERSGLMRNYTGD